MSKSLRIDFFIVSGIVLLSIPLIFKFEVRPFTSAVLFFVIPSAYLFFRKRKPIKRILVGSLFIGMGFGLIFDIIATANNAWNFTSSQLIFNYKIFGFLAVEEPVWFFLWVLFILVFYEHFYDKDKTDKLSKRFKYVVFPTLVVLLLIVFLAIKNKEQLLISHAYFFSAIPAFVPVIYVLAKRPNLVPKFLKTSFFFFMLYLAYELTAIKLGQWYFPGQYIGWVELIDIKFPLEELLFWMGLGSFTVLSLYEGFIDDDK